MKIRRNLIVLAAAGALALSAAAPATAQTSQEFQQLSAQTSLDLYTAGMENPLTQGSTVFLTVGSGGLWLIGCMIQDAIAPGTANCSF